MSQNIRPGKKSFKKLAIALLVLAAGAAFFHKPLLLLACKTMLNSVVPKAEGRLLSYEKMQWEGDAIAISGLQIKDLGSELTIDRIELRFKGDFSHLLLKPQFLVVHPQIVFSAAKTDSTATLPFLYRSRFIHPHWEIKNGVLQLPSAHRFYFSLSPKQDDASIGTFLFSHDPSPVIPPMISGDLSVKARNLQLGFRLQENQLNRLLPLTALIAPEISREWDLADGEVELKGEICFSPDFKLREVHCQGEGKNLDLRGPAMGLDMRSQEIKIAVSYPMDDVLGSFWDKLSASLYLKDGACLIDSPLIEHALGMHAFDAELKFEPKVEPKLRATGTLIKEDRQISFDLNGRGGVGEDKFWSDVVLECVSLQGQTMQAELSLKSDEKRDFSLHVKVQNAGFEHLDFFRAFSAANGECVEGIAQLEGTLLYRQGKWLTASIEDCHLNKIRWYFPEKKVTAYVEQVDGSAAFEKKNGSWNLADLKIQSRGGDYLDPHLHLEKIEAELSVDKGILLPSQIKGSWGELLAEIALSNTDNLPQARIHLHGDAGEVLEFLSQKQNGTSLPIEIQADAQFDKTELRLGVDAVLANEPIKASAAFAMPSNSFSHLLAGVLPQLQLKEAQVQADLLTEKSYGVILPIWSSDIILNGKLQLKILFAPQRTQIQVGGEEIVIRHAMADLFVPQLKEKPAQFVYDNAQKQWRGEISLAEAKVHYHNLGLSFANLDGFLKLDGDHLKAASFYAECEGLALRGNLDVSFTEGKISLATSQIAGDMQSLLSILGHFPSMPAMSLPIKGDFSSGDKGFMLVASAGNVDPEWSFKGTFGNLNFPVNASTAISNGCCEVQFDSKSKRLSIDKAEGIWQLGNGMPFAVQVKRFCSQSNTDLEFAIKVVDGKKEFALLEGKANQTKLAQWEITFDGQSTHFGGVKLNITRCLLNDKMKPVSFEMRPILKCRDLHAQAAFLQNAGFIPPNFSAKNLQEWQLEGTLQAQINTEDISNGFSFRAESRDLKVKGRSWASFHLSGQKIGEKWLIEKLEAEHLSLKGAFLVDADGIRVPQFEGKWQGMQMKGSGQIKSEQKRFSCVFESVRGDLSTLNLGYPFKGTYAAGVSISGDFLNPRSPLQLNGEANLFIDLQAPLPVTAASSKTVKFSYRQETGLICDGVDFLVKHRVSNAFLANLKTGKISTSEPGNLNLQQMQFSVTPAMLGHCFDAKLLPASIRELEWEGNLEGSGDLSLTKQGNTFQGNLKAGRYGFAGKSLVFDQLQVRYEKESLELRMKTKIEDQPLWGTLQVELKKDPYGVVKLFDNPKAEGMKLVFAAQSDKISVQSIQGSCYGMTCNLNKSTSRKVPLATVLSGEIKIDGTQISSLLPTEIRKGLENFKFGNGYLWQGDLVLWQEAQKGFQATGVLRGTEFEAFGYRFRHLEGTVEAAHDRFFISNIKIDDAAGVIGIKKIELSKKEDWQLYIPQIIVRQLQPSKMRKVDGDPQVVKPFMIKNFTMTDIRGKIGDKSTLEGSGRLNFVNQFKKEASILDVPLEMIKKIGLDPGLLTPIQGELEMELRGDKFYLVSLQNAISEGNRAEFYLSPEKNLSYIDLDGKVHIDLNMRQDVMLKITEPFTLTIRGTLDKPRYGLQF